MEILAQSTVSELFGYAVRSFSFLVGIHLVIGFGLLALLRAIDWYEREPFSLIVGMFLWGGLVATTISIVWNTLIIEALSPDVATVFGAAIAAPIVEEIAKGLALVIAFGASLWAGKRYGLFQFGGVTDGIIYGAAVGYGFAIFEDIGYFVNVVLIVAIETGGNAGAALQAGIDNFLMRSDFLGVTGGVLGHGALTAMFGAGLGLAVWTTSWPKRALYAGGGLLAAMVGHAWWNGLVSLVLTLRYGFDTTAHAFAGGQLPADLIAQMEATAATAADVRDFGHFLFVIGAAFAIGLWLRHEGKVIRFELAEEVNYGVMPAEEYHLITHLRGRMGWYLQILKAGGFELLRTLRRSHDKLVELALAKWRIRTLGGDPTHLDQLRREFTALRTAAAMMGDHAPPTPAAQAAPAAPEPSPQVAPATPEPTPQAAQPAPAAAPAEPGVPPTSEGPPEATDSAPTTV